MLSSRPVPPSRTLEFTRTILRRYREMIGRRTGMGAVYLRRSTSPRVQPIHNHTTINLEPKLALTLPSSTTILHHRVKNLTLVQHKRLEAQPTSSIPTGSHRQPPQVNNARDAIPPQSDIAYPPVPRVLRHLTSSDSMPRTSLPSSNFSYRETPETNVQARPKQIKSIDVNHLAEEVIRNIDHRIIAQRERLGRA